MYVLLLFFALPIATIIISIALQKILKSPALVAGIIFSIFLIVTFVIGNLNFLIATIIYTLISYITAILVNLICRLLKRIERCRRENNYNCCTNNENNINELLTINSSCGNNNNGNLLTISSTCQNGENNDLLTINTNQPNSNNCCNNNCNNNCNVSNNGVSARINVIPNNTNSGRTGCICGRYRKN